MKPAASIASIVFMLVALMHLLRVIYQLPVLVGDVAIPMWISVTGTIGPGALAIWLWREQKHLTVK